MVAETSGRAGLLLCMGALCLLPPIALVFDKPINVFGIPLVVLYVFGTWLTLIVLAKVLSDRFQDSDPPQAQ